MKLPKAVLDALQKGIEQGDVIVGKGVNLSQHDQQSTSGVTPPVTPDGFASGIKLTEAEFQQRVIDLAHQNGWIVAHFRPARVLRHGKEIYETAVAADGKGFLDLLMLHMEMMRMLVAELKCGKNKLTDDQLKWKQHFEAAKVPVFVWYPEDWPDIEEALRRVA